MHADLLTDDRYVNQSHNVQKQTNTRKANALIRYPVATQLFGLFTNNVTLYLLKVDWHLDILHTVSRGCSTPNKSHLFANTLRTVFTFMEG